MFVYIYDESCICTGEKEVKVAWLFCQINYILWEGLTS